MGIPRMNALPDEPQTTSKRRRKRFINQTSMSLDLVDGSDQETDPEDLLHHMQQERPLDAFDDSAATPQTIAAGPSGPTGTMSNVVLSDDMAGFSSCPCLGAIDPVDDADLSSNLASDSTIDFDRYGIGCFAHDVETSRCQSNKEAKETPCSSFYPMPADCDTSWCSRRWCYVDPASCSLLLRRSVELPNSNRYYSYATCNEMDSYTKSNRLSSLKGKTIRAGYNANTGGWTGAYSVDGSHFSGPASRWSGPVVDYIHQSSRLGEFQIQIQEPPDFLVNKSIEFFNSNSKFDLCAYATALGYLDLCIAQYSVTDERALSSHWFLLGSDPLFLITIQDDASPKNSWSEFVNQVNVIFQPFHTSTWLFLIFLVVPTLSLLVLLNEYGRPGSEYPREERRNGERRRSSSTSPFHHESFWRYVPRALYVGYISVLQQSYTHDVVSVGGRITLVGVMFFILTIVSVYVANLAAMLTSQAHVSQVNSIDDAINAGYRFCGERKTVSTVMEVMGIEDRFVVDPIELGGDGKAGFNCPNCQSRTRVFDAMLSEIDADDKTHCHAAIAPMEDLEVLQQTAIHCNKTAVGMPVGFVASGIPIFHGVFEEMSSLLLRMRNDGSYEKALKASRPSSTCPSISLDDWTGPDIALSISQLMGIWVVSFGLAATGLLVTFGRPCWKPFFNRCSKKTGQRDVAQERSRHEQIMEKESFIDVAPPSVRRPPQRARDPQRRMSFGATMA